MDLNQKKKYMKMAISLAKKGINKTGSNPIVGAIIVKNNRVIGKGFHSDFGGDHAEIVAIKDAESKGNSVKGSTLFVTLEPCCHTNKKTPPCVNAIINKGIKQVYFLEYDINPKVNGNGVKKLESNKIKVSQINLKNNLKEINRGFESIKINNRPFVTLKICTSLDSKIYTNQISNNSIGDEKQRKHANDIRKNYDAILVGINTIIKDNPKLNYRGKNIMVKQPTPIIMDSNLRIPIESNVLKNKSQKPIIFCATSASEKKIKILESNKIMVIKLKKISPKNILKHLLRLNFQRLLVEGGGSVFSSFLKENLWDEMLIYYSKIFIGKSGLGLSDTMDELNKIKEKKIDKINKIGNSILVRIS